MIAKEGSIDLDGKNFMPKINLDTKIDEDTIKKFAPKIVAGTKRLKDWGEKG